MKFAVCVFSRPIKLYQVRIYRTIGPLVIRFTADANKKVHVILIEFKNESMRTPSFSYIVGPLLYIFQSLLYMVLT